MPRVMALANPVSVPYLRYNNYGGSIGGPILKKKMFFYFNFDKLGHYRCKHWISNSPDSGRTSRRFYRSAGDHDPTTQVVRRRQVVL